MTTIHIFLKHFINIEHATTIFRKVYRNRAKQLLSVLLVLAAEISNVLIYFLNKVVPHN